MINIHTVNELRRWARDDKSVVQEQLDLSASVGYTEKNARNTGLNY